MLAGEEKLESGKRTETDDENEEQEGGERKAEEKTEA